MGRDPATKLVHSMRRDDLERGLVTPCIGGGQGIALAIENCAPDRDLSS
jgi:acetyl-CoA acetyltransferase